MKTPLEVLSEYLPVGPDVWFSNTLKGAAGIIEALNAYGYIIVNEYEIAKLRAELKVALEDVEYYKERYYLAHTECARRGAELTRLQNIINGQRRYSESMHG